MDEDLEKLENRDMDLAVTLEILEDNGVETGRILTIAIPQGENVILSESGQD